MADTERMRELRAELARYEEDERREAAAEQQRIARESQKMSAAEVRRAEDQRFMGEYASMWNVALRDNSGQKIIPKSLTDRYEKARLVEGVAPALARCAAIKYGPSSTRVQGYLRLAGADSLDAYVPPAPV